MTHLMDFSSTTEREQWIVKNADYFIVIRRFDRKNHRVECSTLADAEALAQQVIQFEPDARLLIYAVAGISDTFVKAIAKDEKAKNP